MAMATENKTRCWLITNVPANRWQELKKHYAPKWFIRFFPVKYIEQRQELETLEPIRMVR